jgi:hypothetical protein
LVAKNVQDGFIGCAIALLATAMAMLGAIIWVGDDPHSKSGGERWITFFR